MTDIRDLILGNDDDDNMDKVAEQGTGMSDSSEHIKIAEQLEALSDDDTMTDDLLKLAIYQEHLESLAKDAKKGGK